MGLDITAFQDLVFAAPGEGRNADGEVDDEAGYFELYIDADRQDRAAGLPSPCVCRGYGDSTGFRAGSYGYYSVWRNQLAQLAGYGNGAEATEESDTPHSVAA